MSAPVSFELVFGFLLFAAVFMPLEWWLPLRQKPAFRRGWFTDVLYFAAGCFVGHVSDAASLGGMLLIRDAAGLNPANLVSTQPGWLQFLEIIVIADFLAYFYHRSIHAVGRLWRLHQIHHSSEWMDWLANSRLHPVDKILGDCVQFIPIFWLGFGDAPLLAYTIFLGFQGFLNHSNVRINYGPLRWIVATPAFHHWHHCDDPKAYNKNFSPHLVVWDRLFGTFYLPADGSLPDKYGVSDPMPAGFWAQLLYPFRRGSSTASGGTVARPQFEAGD